MLIVCCSTQNTQVSSDCSRAERRLVYSPLWDDAGKDFNVCLSHSHTHTLTLTHSHTHTLTGRMRRIVITKKKE